MKHFGCRKLMCPWGRCIQGLHAALHFTLLCKHTAQAVWQSTSAKHIGEKEHERGNLFLHRKRATKLEVRSRQQKFKKRESRKTTLGIRKIMQTGEKKTVVKVERHCSSRQLLPSSYLCVRAFRADAREHFGRQKHIVISIRSSKRYLAWIAELIREER